MRHTAFGLVLLLSMAGCSGGGADCCGPPPDPDPDPDPVPGAVALVSIVDGRDQRAEVGKELPEAVVVRASDAQALAVPDQLINFVVVSGGGSVFAGAAQTNDLGEARERWTLGTTAGEQVLEARAVDQNTGDPIVFSRITATADPGPAARLTLQREPRAADAYHQMFMSESFNVASLLVGVADQYGNAVADPVLTVEAAPAFEVDTTSIMSRVEVLDTVTVRSGEATDSVIVTVVRHLSELAGARGGWACVGTRRTHFDDEGDVTLIREEGTFVVDSVVYGTSTRMWTTKVVTFTRQDHTTRAATFPDAMTVGLQVPGAFFFPEGTSLTNVSENWARQTSESPLTYVGPPYCQGWGRPDSFEPFTITR